MAPPNWLRWKLSSMTSPVASCGAKKFGESMLLPGRT